MNIIENIRTIIKTIKLTLNQSTLETLLTLEKLLTGWLLNTLNQAIAVNQTPSVPTARNLLFEVEIYRINTCCIQTAESLYNDIRRKQLKDWMEYLHFVHYATRNYIKSFYSTVMPYSPCTSYSISTRISYPKSNTNLRSIHRPSGHNISNCIAIPSSKSQCKSGSPNLFVSSIMLSNVMSLAPKVDELRVM